MEKEKIRPLYAELQGCLTQAPDKTDWFGDKSIWEHYNGTVNLLNEVTGKNYSRYCISPEPGKTAIRGSAYRQKIGALIAHLHGEYFSDEPAPFSGMPSTIITQTQQQSQSVLIQMIFDFQDKIEQSMGKYTDGSKEKTFLQKLKGSIRNITDFTQMVLAVSQLAKDCGISVEDLGKIFS